MPRVKCEPLAIKKEDIDNDDHDASPPPMLEAETEITNPPILSSLDDDDVEEHGAFEDNDVSSSYPPGVPKTLQEMLNAQFNESTTAVCSEQHETSPVSDSEPPKLVLSKMFPLSKILSSTPSTSSNGVSTFRSVVGMRYATTEKNTRLRSATIKRGISPSVPTTSIGTKRPRSSDKGVGLTQLLKNQAPIRVDVQVGNGSPPCSTSFGAGVRGRPPKYKRLNGQTSSSSNERGDGSAIESSPSPNNDFNGSLRHEDPEHVRNSFRNIGIPENIVKDASQHDLLLGCMIMNGLTTLQKRGQAYSNSFRDDLYSLLRKYNIH